MHCAPQVADHEVRQILQTEVDLPLSLLVALLGLAVLFGPHLVRKWKQRRDTRRP